MPSAGSMTTSSVKNRSTSAWLPDLARVDKVGLAEKKGHERDRTTNSNRAEQQPSSQAAIGMTYSAVDTPRHTRTVWRPVYHAAGATYLNVTELSLSAILDSVASSSWPVLLTPSMVPPV